MVDVTLTDLLGSNPVTADLTGDEPIETVKSGVSEAATLRQLSSTPINAQVGTSYSLILTDQGGVVTMANASANSVTIPLNATIAFPIGATMLVRWLGTGITSIAAAGGVTIQKKASIGLALSEQYATALLHKVAVNTWAVTGELAPI